MSLFEKLGQKIRDKIFNKNTKDIEEILWRLGKGSENCYKCPIFISEHCKTEEAEEGDKDNDDL